MIAQQEKARQLQEIFKALQKQKDEQATDSTAGAAQPTAGTSDGTQKKKKKKNKKKAAEPEEAEAAPAK